MATVRWLGLAVQEELGVMVALAALAGWQVHLEIRETKRGR